MRQIICIIMALIVPDVCVGADTATNTSKQNKQLAKSGSQRVDVMHQQVIDLSHTFDKQTIYWPTENGFRLIPEKAGITEKGYYYSSNRFMAAEHGGTHLDAPVHFNENGKSVDKLPLRQLMGEAAVIDVTAACRQDPDYQISVADLRAWEEKTGRQLVDVIVLLNTGYAQHWSDRKKYLGTDQLGTEAVAKLHFPGLDPEAARWLTEHRAIKAIGLDTASIDYGQSTRFQSHVTLFKHEIPAFENVADMSRLPISGTTVVALPMKIGGGSGGPLRIVAWLPSEDKRGASRKDR
ncbi:cyclase family protein [Rubripirellula sp.]|nr:cyclase family protein [Rubripirellula sp.]MDB4654025.1 cyclase family protein [bacterium]MDC0317111.1 cyclase family protein [bacterium]